MAASLQTGSPPRAWGQRGRREEDARDIRFTPTRVGTTSSGKPRTPGEPVHPHARGDNWAIPSTVANESGSPPRAWGQRRTQHLCRGPSWFTPTRVGTTLSPLALLAASTVHPHARGDNQVYQSQRVGVLGSPPRAWGQHTPAATPAALPGSPPRAWGQDTMPHDAKGQLRFTPTRVGTTSSVVNILPRLTVHPHARGDNWAIPSTVANESGSPPRAWGQRGSRLAYYRLYRFTPTRVGTTFPPVAPASCRPVHPHARGDNSSDSCFMVHAAGSPPRAWGQQINERQTGTAGRFTPTRVGTTISVSTLSARTSVHPHARGDNALICTESYISAGSPPRAWGQLPKPATIKRLARFTPTRVGTTPASPARGVQQSVHPHARGDNLPEGRPRRSAVGSPPRAWGQHCLRLRPPARRRFTPTRVGTTQAGLHD